MKANKVLAPYFQKWDTELELKLRSGAIREVHEMSKLKGTQGLAAAKYIAGKEWEKGNKGRPKKADVERRIKQDADLAKQVNEDYELVGKHES